MEKTGNEQGRQLPELITHPRRGQQREYGHVERMVERALVPVLELDEVQQRRVEVLRDLLELGGNLPRQISHIMPVQYAGVAEGLWQPANRKKYSVDLALVC